MTHFDDLFTYYMGFFLRRLYIVTWNVSTKFPENLSIHSLLNLESNPENDDQLPDFYVIGLQEVNAQPQNVLANFFRDDPWTNKVKELLKDRGYVAVKSEHMQGLLLTVFAKRLHIMHLREIETEYTRTGLGGIWVSREHVT
jgi:inositol polyphosphate 5-phosphatase INPP5J/K